MMELDEFVTRALLVPWVERGRSFDGWDCWGLTVVAYREVLGIDIPSWAYCAIREPWGEWSDRELPRWYPPGCDAGHGNDPEPMDVAVFLQGGRVSHVALAIDAHRGIHSHEGIGTVVERFDSNAWSMCLEGFYRIAS